MSAFLIYGMFMDKNLELSPDSSKSEISEECNVLQENGEGINILFFSGGEIAKDYMDYFLESEPFNEVRDNFNFFYIEDYIPECELYEGEIFYCYSKELIKKSSVCPNDYLVVLGDYPSEIRSSAFMNVLSINSNHPKSVFLHEFGHTFANFAEEYVDENARIPSKAKNCVSSCDDFGEGVECFEGCTKSNYYRSSLESVMRTLNTRNYGLFNNNFILERIDDEVVDSSLFTTGNVVSSKADCSSEEYYLLEIGSGKVSKSVQVGCSGSSGHGDTEYLVLSEDDSIFSKGDYNKDFLFTTLPFPDGKLSGKTYKSDRDIFLKIPVSKIKDGVKVSSTDLAILTEENKNLFEKNVDEKLSLEDIEKFGKKDFKHLERRVVKVREVREIGDDDFENEEIFEDEEEIVEGDDIVDGEIVDDSLTRQSLFSLIVGMISDFGNSLFSERVTGRVVEDDLDEN